MARHSTFAGATRTAGRGLHVHVESVREHLVAGDDVLVEKHFGCGVCWVLSRVIDREELRERGEGVAGLGAGQEKSERDGPKGCLVETRGATEPKFDQGLWELFLPFCPFDPGTAAKGDRVT
jgi:hypothetical protein